MSLEYLRGELLFALGQYDDAERWFSTWSNADLADPFLAPRTRRLAQLEERRGKTQKAIAYYEQFVELWKDCDPGLRPQVDEARTHLAALEKNR